MKYKSRSIYGCTAAEPEFTPPPDCRFTQSADGKRLYLHLFAYPFKYLRIPSLSGRVEYAQFLHDASEAKILRGNVRIGDVAFNDGGAFAIELPDVKPDVPVPVVEFFLK